MTTATQESPFTLASVKCADDMCNALAAMKYGFHPDIPRLTNEVRRSAMALDAFAFVGHQPSFDRLRVFKTELDRLGILADLTSFGR